ncbi:MULTISPECIES: hybrid sensor histidine kinase/response regulator transcription factor [unclassified Paenibacillus]|uniref:helix-turn-helix transcriptional regulator n=1 Tax=unclassified Paenibacillus TaxID=185978 RepID=UPI001C10859B|nr:MULTISPECIES: hybrid sensor histidine kinase/response regulator transcription factor [unclassified Paenibacillus]MBU5444823.1 hybrid sensor histidine kinase/response regulator transcription factor [Paenibacillus sp. MSJ-34]CAH0121529.1 Protein-glutamate methylesterase/protein-glutamine glutaminase [Paenibacillus sp. CECT 9249]
MYDIIKKWYWFDWMVFVIRSIWFISVLIGVWHFHHDLSFPLWMMIGMPLIVFSVPFLFQQFFKPYYMFAEIFIAGGYSIFLAFLLHEAQWQFLPIAFVIGFYSIKKSYIWTCPFTIVVIPLLIGLVTDQTLGFIVMKLMFHHGVAYALGYAFQLLVTNHKQGLMIREQNNALEQYVYQVEQLTALEERHRLSQELHHAVGNSLIAIIRALESIGSSLADESAKDKLKSVMESAHAGLQEMKRLVHEQEASEIDLTLVQYAKNVIRDFVKSTNASVKFRFFGNEYHVAKEAKLTIIRCMQEALTGAVRNGHASEIKVYLYFDRSELRLQVEDNGETGRDELGFGLSALKQRVEAVQGKLSIYTEGTEGTVILCNVPRTLENNQQTMKVVLVGEQGVILDSLKTTLERHDHLQIVGMAASGEEGIAMCASTHPDIVLMDVNTPAINGMEAMAAMKEIAKSIKVVILSSSEDVNQAVSALQHGANGYLLKSIQTNELIETLSFIHRGDTIISHEIANQVFEELQNRNVPNGNRYGLTPREIEIITYLSKGMRYKSIAARLYLSEGTVRNYASEMYAKLQVNNREQAIRKCVEEGII